MAWVPCSVQTATVTLMTTGIEPRKTTLPCGLHIVSEHNEAQRSASVCWLVPGGFAYDPLAKGDGWVLLSPNTSCEGPAGMEVENSPTPWTGSEAVAR